jgi:23S rRNA pseudouridine1911/1915/1917 synthase
MDLIPEIIYEDNHIIAVNKKAGQIVQGDKTGDIPLSDLVKKYIKEKYNKPGEVFLGVPHRLDRPVSGVVLFTRTSKSLTRLTQMFKSKETHKTYHAVVASPPPASEGRLVGNIFRNTKQNKSYILDRESDQTKLAMLDYKLVAKSEKYFLLEINLITGRHHQIRCQLAHMGCPIRGDLKYGYHRSNPNGGINLHSVKIKFVHPVQQQPIEIIAAYPNEGIWKVFEL